MTTTSPPPSCTMPTAAAELRALSDDQLMNRIREDHLPAALAVLRSRHARWLGHHLRTWIADPALLDEVTQETFIRVFTRSHLYRVPGGFRRWLAVIARNLAVTALRRAERRAHPGGAGLPAHTLVGPATLTEISDGLDHREPEEHEFADLFARAVAALPAPFRQAFELCVLQGLSYKEVAARTRAPIGTVAARVLRARRKLFARLGHLVEPLRRAAPRNPPRWHG